MVVHARRALIRGAIEEHVAIELDGSRITGVRTAGAGDPPAEDGLVVPGLVNAHLHLELSGAAGRVPGGDGLFAWVDRLRGLDVEEPELAAVARRVHDAGTVLVSDVSNRGHTGPVLAEAGLAGVVQHEHLGMHGPALAERVRAVEGMDLVRHGEIVTRPSPHAVYSTPPALLAVAGRRMGGVVGSVHVSEDPDEHVFLERGEGPLAAWMTQVGIDWSWFTPPRRTPVGVLDALGLLGPELLLVHGVCFTEQDVVRVARSGAALCLCARSNRHIGGRLPEVGRLREAGIGLCLGSDSLASSPDLDVLGEVATWVRACPEVPAVDWLVAATAGGADALRWPGVGRIEVGARPGLLLLEGVDAPEALGEVPPRRWLVRRT